MKGRAGSPLAAFVATRSLTFARAAAVFACVLAASNNAFAERLTFEGLTDGACCVPVPSGYGGLDWDNFELIRSNWYPTKGSGYDAGVVSGQYGVFAPFGNPAKISGGLFTFGSAYFTAALFKDLNLTIEGWNGSTQLFATTLILNPGAPTFYAANWSGIDRLELKPFGGVDAGLGGGTQFVMDDFSYGMDATQTPEPASVLLLTTGLAGVGVRRWKTHRGETRRINAISL